MAEGNYVLLNPKNWLGRLSIGKVLKLINRNSKLSLKSMNEFFLYVITPNRWLPDMHIFVHSFKYICANNNFFC